VHKPTPSPASAPTPTQPKPPKADKPAAPPKADPPPAKADAGGCDEISCVLNNNEGPCCAKFAKKGGKAAPSGAASGAGKSDLPDSLDRAMISDGIGKIRARVMACGDKSPAKGQVRVSVKVGPDGRVTSVTVKNTPDDGLGNCVASMVQKATFAKTQTGGLFAYPYTF
jgi:TonB family protein